MKYSKLLILLLILIMATGCGGGGGGSSSPAPKTLVSISVTPTNPTLAKGTILQFTATGTYSDNSTQNLTSSVTWSSESAAIASISNAAGTIGTATAITPGVTTITATSGAVSGTTALTVTPATLQSLALSPTNPSIARGTTVQFTATGTYSDNSTQDLTTQVSWNSTAPAVAVVSNAGTATAVAAGTTTITANSGSIAGTTTLTVTPAILQSLAVSPTNPSIARGTAVQFTATGTYSDNSTQDLTTSATWSSSNSAVASISNAAGTNGRATAIATGTATITAASGNISGTTTLTVTPATLQSLAVSPTNLSIARGTAVQFTATGTYSDGSTQNLTVSATWSSSNSAVASISNAAGSNGRATAIAVGTATITVASGNIAGSTTLTVTPATLQSLAISPTNQSLVQGATLQFTATGTYSDNSTQSLTTSVTWSSAAPTVATIGNAAGSQGLAAAVAAGTTTITAVSGSITSATSLTVTGSVGGVNNVLPITVNGSLCAANSYTNKPCVSVTVCAPGTSSCQTITDILLDTGSYGLRIFKELLPVAIQQATGNAGLANCVQFGDGSSLWGAVQTASVTLGSEPAVSVPIQVVSSTFGTANRPTACSNARQTAAAAGFSGILGVGLLSHDCGTACVNGISLCIARNENCIYYNCNGSTCTSASVPLASQVQNPVTLLPVDNNGVIVKLPSVPLGGAPAVGGSLVLGIDTRPNNTSSGATAYAANQSARFTTTFSGVSYSSSFIDSGSNGLFFTSPSASLLPNCPVSTGFYCPPPPPVSLFATNTAVSGTPIRVDFQIGNANNLFGSGNKVFIEIGGSYSSGTSFDWGLPFFFGRNVYVGFEEFAGKSPSSLGTGPRWAY